MNVVHVTKVTQSGKSNHNKSRLCVLDHNEYVHNKRRYWAVKRAQDVILSATALILLSPLMLVTVIAIVVDDPHGSPIFSQIRVGRNGKKFRMYKFRSMYVDAEEHLEELLSNNKMDGPVFKMDNDPRITRIGAFIRATSIDELPQLWNILKGDMTIVGPRPALPKEVEQYSDLVKQRLFVTPGLTCYWQISPDRNDISFNEWMEMDLKYIQERSILTDWKIILKTLHAVLHKEGM